MSAVGAYEVTAAAGAIALWENATYGIRARCTYVNAQMSDNLRLPVKWRSANHQEGRGIIVPPFTEVYTTGLQRPEPPIVIGPGEYMVGVVVKAWLNAKITKYNMVSLGDLYRRLSWAQMMLLTNRATASFPWDGTTLVDTVQSVHAIRIIPILRMDGKTKEPGGIGSETRFNVIVAETDVRP